MTNPKLNPTRNYFNFFGSLSRNPDFIRKPTVSLNSKDFVHDFHKVLFFAFNNITKLAGAKNEISVIDVDNFLEKYEKSYNIWKSQNGVQWLTEAIDNSNDNLMIHDYQTIKKYSILRRYEDNGIDITDLYDYNGSTEIANQGRELIESMSTSEIVDHYSSKVLKIRKSWQDQNTDNTSFKAGDNIDYLLQHLHDKPDFGYPFMNTYYNRLFGGMRSSKYLLRSTSTGGGKTRSAIRDICHVAFNEIYIPGSGWKNMGVSKPCLFISTELDKDELQVLMLGYLTGVGTQQISYGHFTKEVEERLKHGAEIIKKSHLFFEYIEDFSTDDIEALIDQYVLDEHVEYINFDYIQASPRLMSSLKESYGMGLREDQALVYFSKELKRMATKYNVFLMSSTQVNAGFMDDDPSKARTEQALRGGKSIADKIDFGVITSHVSELDLRRLKPILDETGKKPNYAHWIYKNRNGAKRVVLWTHYDMATMRETTLFVTGYDYLEYTGIKPLDIQLGTGSNNNISF